LIANLLSQISFGLLVMTICLPSMQQWGALFGARQASVQLTFIAYVVAFGLLQVVYGLLSDRYGRRKLLRVGLVPGIAGVIFAALATFLWALTMARALQGVGTAAGLRCLPGGLVNAPWFGAAGPVDAGPYPV